MRDTVNMLEDQLAEAVSDVLEYPFTIGLTINKEFEPIIDDSERKSFFESELRDNISNALQIPKSLVSVLSYHRGSIIAEVKLSSDIPNKVCEQLRTGKMLAVELARQVEEQASIILEGSITSSIIAAEVHGPISEATVRAFRSSVLERERANLRKDEDLNRLQRLISDNQVM